MEEVSKRDRQKQHRIEKRQGPRSVGKFLLWAVLIGAVGAIGYAGFWFVREVAKPMPGSEIADMGQDHTTDISGVTYNSDPPTSGPHFPVWAKRGIYDRVLSNGHLIHSLEHGYIVISYNCDKKVSLIPQVSAQEASPEPSTPSAKPLTRMVVGVTGAMSFFGTTNPPPVEVELPESFKTEECKKLAADLWDVGDGWSRVIVVPRPGMDSRIALTAWRRIEKLDTLDKGRIENFIAYYHNKGPEKTQE